LADHSAISERLGVHDDRAFAAELIDRCGVATIPPSAFYSPEGRSMAHPLIRFAFCKTRETIDAAIGGLRELPAPTAG
jgi:aspartate/methionine/tyrosine aminotransferase